LILIKEEAEERAEESPATPYITVEAIDIESRA